MLKRFQGFIIGVVICSLAAGGAALAATTQTQQAYFNNIKIVVDGKEIHPQDAAGNSVEPFIVNGTTYLPVRAVADALGKEVYWDGPNYTVYLGNMGGRLEYPSLRMENAVDIGGGWYKAGTTSQLTDNYGNRYATAMSGSRNTFQTLLNMKYSRFKTTVYVEQGSTTNSSRSFTIEADGKIIYLSPEITKTSAPIYIDVDISGCNDFKVIPNDLYNSHIWFADAGFYQ